jgi:hypothetical protein
MMIFIQAKFKLNKICIFESIYLFIYFMTTIKQIRKKRNDIIVKDIEKKFGVSLGYSSDADLHTDLKNSGVPSLSKL